MYISVYIYIQSTYIYIYTYVKYTYIKWGKIFKTTIKDDWVDRSPTETARWKGKTLNVVAILGHLNIQASAPMITSDHQPEKHVVVNHRIFGNHMFNQTLFLSDYSVHIFLYLPIPFTIKLEIFTNLWASMGNPGNPTPKKNKPLPMMCPDYKQPMTPALLHTMSRRSNCFLNSSVNVRILS